MLNDDAYAEPIMIQTHNGAVIVRAPEGPAIFAQTPDAAMASAERLYEAARVAIACLPTP